MAHPPPTRYLHTPGGNPAHAQVVYDFDDYEEFHSYGSLIVTRYRDERKTILHPAWNASQTTNKYRNQFLGETLAETRAKAEAGEYVLAEGATLYDH